MINEKLLKQAIKVLKSLNEKHYEDSSKKKPLLEDEKEITVYLQISLKKIPKLKSTQMIKINLPHSLLKDNSEVCLITGDLDKRNHKAEIEPDVLHYKELLKKHDVDRISEVLTLRQLRTEYKPYEAKQKLLAAFDVFLADRKIAECLPRVLGRHFYKKRKFPIQVTINTSNLKQQIERALSTKVFYLTGHGNSCNSEVAHLDMSDTEILENVMAVAKAFCDRLPGSWNNVMGIYLKTALSKAVPVYISYDNPNEVHLDEVKNENTFVIDELSTFPDDGLVKVYKDGSIRRLRKKRISEIETEIGDATDDSVDSEKKEKSTTNDVAEVTNADSNKESSELKRKNKKKKKEENILKQETDKSLCSMESKEESPEVSRKSKKKKKEGTILEQETDKSLCSIESKEESSEVSRKSKKKKKEGNILEQETDKSLCSIESKEESSEVRRKSKRKKNEENILKQETDKSLCSIESKDESAMMKKKSKSKKNEEEAGESVSSVRVKGKQKKRYHL